MAAKRRDYFAAGASVVWDVDVLRDEVVRVYRASGPENPTLYRRGEVAEAEPAVQDGPSLSTICSFEDRFRRSYTSAAPRESAARLIFGAL